MEHVCAFGTSPYKLSDLQLFLGTDDGEVAALLAACPVVRLQPGQAIATTRTACLYIVLRGALNVASDGKHGGAESAGKVLPGESVGEQSVLDEESNLSAISAPQETDLLLIEAHIVWQLIEQSNVLARNLLRLLSFRVRAANAQLRRRQKVGEFYRQLSMVDGLTGLYNRAWLSDLLPAMITAAQHAGTPLTLIMLDLDHFKRFNDTHGHVAGDQALRTAARVLSAALRPSDCAVRYGGEEMMVILPDTGDQAALLVAQRLCERIRQSDVFGNMRVGDMRVGDMRVGDVPGGEAGISAMHPPLPHITASFGVASLAPGQDEHALIAAADAALYRAKNGGRDRVSL